MKKVLFRLPLLSLIGGLILLFFPENIQGQSHSHGLHLILVGIPLSIFFLLILRQKRIIEIYSKFQVVTIITLFLFTALHFTPIVAAFKYHHQSQSAIEHPCCIPQLLANPVEFIKIRITIQSFLLIPQIDPHLPSQIFVKVINNKSPPNFLS